VLQSVLVDANDDDAIVVGPRSAQSETHVERALLDVTNKLESGAVVATDTGVGEDEEAERGDEKRDGEIGVACEEAQDLR